MLKQIMSNLEIFRQLMLQINNGIEEESDNEDCAHEDTVVDSCRVICADCGVMLSEKYLIDQGGGVGMKRRKRLECPIYNEIPAYVPQHIKDLTIEIYKAVTGKEIFRNTFRKSIILACLHRAAIIKESPICFDEMLEMFSLKTHEANKGVGYVANNIPKDSPYTIPFLNDEISIGSNLTIIGLSHALQPVTNLFQFVKAECDILNNSHCKSVVCGCIFFWIKLNNVNISLKQFALKVCMSEMTIVKKYIIISKVVLKSLMKRLFSNLLTGCKITGTSKKIKSREPGALYEHTEQVFIRNHKDPERLTADDISGFQFPLDDVEDVCEWDMFLNKKYYDETGKIMSVYVTIIETTRDIKFNFEKYDKLNKQDGEAMLKAIILEKLESYPNIKK